MPEPARPDPDDDLPGEAASRIAPGPALVLFGFGAGAGFLLAFAGLGVLEQGAGVVAAILLAALVVLAAIGLAVVLLRRRLMRALFGLADAEIERIHRPLAQIAEGLAEGRPASALPAARRLVQVLVARYAWLSTRRWLLTALTALIAALAALAGTALLFRQNALIAGQSALLSEQNALLADQSERVRQQTELLAVQTRLLEQSNELAEAARSAGLAVEVVGLAAELAAEAQRLGPAPAADPGAMPDLDPARMAPGLMFRVIALSQGLRPYRFLDAGLRPQDDDERVRLAFLPRRAELPALWARLAAARGWDDRAPLAELSGRPASPERGMLLRILLANGLRRLELLSFYGLDLGHAHAPGTDLLRVSLQNARLPYADFAFGSLVEAELGGALAAGLRLERAQVLRTSFASVPAPQARGPFAGSAGMRYLTRLSGADFHRALVVDCRFAGAEAYGVRFDGALLIAPDFSEAALAGSTFRGAVLVAPVWQGARLTAVDLDGAWVFGADPLAEIAAAADAGSFRAAAYRADPVDPADALAATPWDALDAEGLGARIGAVPAWRLSRIAPID